MKSVLERDREALCRSGLSLSFFGLLTLGTTSDALNSLGWKLVE
jgi:hypothetical protein